jgi:DNA-binding XRE family transcriptional regulator
MCIGSSPVDDKSLSENKNTHTQTWDKMTITLGMQIESLSRFSISQWEKDIYSPSLKPKNTENSYCELKTSSEKHSFQPTVPWFWLEKTHS